MSSLSRVEKHVSCTLHIFAPRRWSSRPSRSGPGRWYARCRRDGKACSTRGEFESSEVRNPETFFSGQEEERLPVAPHFNKVGLRPVTIISILWPSTSRQSGMEMKPFRSFILSKFNPSVISSVESQSICPNLDRQQNAPRRSENGPHIVIHGHTHALKFSSKSKLFGYEVTTGCGFTVGKRG